MRQANGVSTTPKLRLLASEARNPRPDAILVALCATLQASLAVVRSLDADPGTTFDEMARTREVQDRLMVEVAETPARTAAGRRAKAALAVDVLDVDSMEFLHSASVMTFLEGLARDVLVEVAQ
jgi:hypothetical protein